MNFKSVYVQTFAACPGHTIDMAAKEVCEFLAQSKQSSVAFEFNGTKLKIYREYPPEEVVQMYWEDRHETQ